MVVLAIIVRAFTVWMRYQDEAPLRDLQQAVRTGEDYTLRIAVTPEEAEDLIENFTLRDDPQREQLRSVDYDQNMALFSHSSRGEFAGPVLASQPGSSASTGSFLLATATLDQARFIGRFVNLLV